MAHREICTEVDVLFVMCSLVGSGLEMDTGGAGVARRWILGSALSDSRGGK